MLSISAATKAEALRSLIDLCAIHQKLAKTARIWLFWCQI